MSPSMISARTSSRTLRTLCASIPLRWASPSRRSRPLPPPTPARPGARRDHGSRRFAAAAWHFLGSLSTTAPLSCLDFVFRTHGHCLAVRQRVRRRQERRSRTAHRPESDRLSWQIHASAHHWELGWRGEERRRPGRGWAGTRRGLRRHRQRRIGDGPLRATFQVDDVHSGARIWSQTLAPILEDPKSALLRRNSRGVRHR